MTFNRRKTIALTAGSLILGFVFSPAPTEWHARPSASDVDWQLPAIQTYDFQKDFLTLSLNQAWPREEKPKKKVEKPTEKVDKPTKPTPPAWIFYGVKVSGDQREAIFKVNDKILLLGVGDTLVNGTHIEEIAESLVRIKDSSGKVTELKVFG